MQYLHNHVPKRLNRAYSFLINSRSMAYLEWLKCHGNNGDIKMMLSRVVALLIMTYSIPRVNGVPVPGNPTIPASVVMPCAECTVLKGYRNKQNQVR